MPSSDVDRGGSGGPCGGGATRGVARDASGPERRATTEPPLHRVELSREELAAIVDALKWNVAKQSWLKRAWKDATAREGHRRRQAQAERVLDKLEELLWK